MDKCNPAPAHVQRYGTTLTNYLGNPIVGFYEAADGDWLRFDDPRVQMALRLLAVVEHNGFSELHHTYKGDVHIVMMMGQLRARVVDGDIERAIAAAEAVLGIAEKGGGE